MSKTLPVLLSEYSEIMHKLLETEGQLTVEMEEDLKNLDSMIPAKVSQYIFVMDKLDSDAAHFDQKAKEYKEVSKRLETAQKNIKDRIKQLMLNYKLTEIDGGDEVFKLSKSKPRLVIDEEKLDDSFKVVVQSVEPDKEMISQYLKDGLPVIGATLEDVYSLRISKKKGT